METEKRIIKATRITFSSGAKVGGGFYSIGARWGHSSITLSGKRILVFCGQGESLYSNTSVYDPVTSVWSEVNTVDKGPSGRYGHTATLLEDTNEQSNQKVLIFGGKSGKKYLNDLFSLDLRTMSWSTFHFEKSSLPDSRAGHSSSFIPSSGNVCSRLVVFGGSHSDKYLNSCFVLEFPKTSTQGSLKWTKPPIKGKAPQPRCGHTADYLRDRNSILIFGGFDGRKSYNDLHLLNMTDLSWTAVKAFGTIPSSRNGHTSVLVGNRYLVFYGGCSDSLISNDVQILDTDSFTWLQQPMISGLQLFPRFNHSSNILDSGEMIVFGGCASGVLYSDMCCLDLKSFLPINNIPINNTTTTTTTTTSVSLPTTPIQINNNSNNNNRNNNNDIIPSTTTTSTKEITYSIPPYTIGLIPSHSNTTTPTPLSPITTSSTATSSCNSCEHHRKPTTTTTTTSTPDNLLSIQLSNALSLLNSEQNQKTNLSDELMKTKNERAEAFRNAMEEQSKIESLEKELNKIENAYKKEVTQKTKVQDSLFKISSTLKEKETIIQSYQELMNQLKINLSKDPSFLENRRDSTIVQLFYQFSNLSTPSQQVSTATTLSSQQSSISSTPLIANSTLLDSQSSTSILLTKENILNRSLELQIEEVKKENLLLKLELSKDKMKSLECDLIKQTITNKFQKQHEHISVENILGDKLDSLTMKDLDKLEETYHNGLKRVGAAKQDLLQQQLIKMQREKDENASNGNGKTCAICVDLLINVVLVPCRHSCICSTCAKKVSICPICRAPIKDIIEYY